MRSIFSTSRLLVLATAAARLPAQAETPEQLYEEACYQEEAAGDAQAALRAYRAALAAPGIAPRLAARVHLRLGLCHERQGDEEGAQRHYAAALAIPAAEPEIARAARRRLRQPEPNDPARYMPADVLVYLEMVEPRRNVEGIATLLEGTPFQNPVDYYVSLRQADSAAPPLAGSDAEQVRQAAAFLNVYFLEELEKVEALAVAIPAKRDDDEDFLAALLPGESILRGLVHFALTLTGAPRVSRVRDISVFRIEERDLKGPPDARFHVAVGPNVILLGKPRRLVEEAAARGPGGAPSLADDSDFLKASSARSGSFMLSYVRAASVLASLRAEAAPEHGPALDALVTAAGLDHLVSADFVLSRVDDRDALRLAARVRMTGAGLRAWQRFASPALDDRLLRAVPADALACLAAGIEDGVQWARALEDSLQPLIEASGDEGSWRPARSLLQFFRDGEGQAFLAELRGVALGVGAVPAEQGIPPYFVAFALRDPTTGRAAVEAACVAFFARFLRNSLPRGFEDANGEAHRPGAALRTFEALPGVRLFEGQIGGALLLTTAPGLLERAAAAPESRGGSPASFLPLGSGKGLFLRPEAILTAAGRRGSLPAELQAVLQHIPRLVVATREAEDSLALEVIVPEITRTVRGVLATLAEALRKSRESSR